MTMLSIRSQVRINNQLVIALGRKVGARLALLLLLIIAHEYVIRKILNGILVFASKKVYSDNKDLLSDLIVSAKEDLPSLSQEAKQIGL